MAMRPLSACGAFHEPLNRSKPRPDAALTIKQHHAHDVTCSLGCSRPYSIDTPRCTYQQLLNNRYLEISAVLRQGRICRSSIGPTLHEYTRTQTWPDGQVIILFYSKWHESGSRPLSCTYMLNWARRSSRGWWDEWDNTALQTQDLKFKPWISEFEYASSRSRRHPTILSVTSGRGRNICVSFKPPRPGNETLTLALEAALLTTTLGPRPCSTSPQESTLGLLINLRWRPRWPPISHIAISRD